jgi:flavin reductase (DIM6/NTAB) family NADH-FMN oxidoreductase RutF
MPDSLDLPDSDTFRRALRPLIGQVSVITLMGSEGAMGMTLTSASALSTQPPMLIACINRSASLHGALIVGAVLGWQSLGAGQQAVAERFAGKDGIKGAARFDGADWREETHASTPVRLLQGASLACAVQIDSMADHATHSVVIARILSLHSAPEAGTLAYRDGQYLPFATGMVLPQA